MTVSLFVKQFSVSDYIYDYTFSTPNDWVFLSKDQVQLKAGESQKIDYTVTVPKGSAPGGHYYTLFASARVQSGGVVSAMQTTDLLYVTVNGKLTTSNHIEKTAVPQVVFDSRIPYQMDVRNTGNVHYFAYFTGSVKGFLTDNNEPLTSHLLMPGTVKHITGTVPSPLWPGIYTVTYGYQTENTPEVTRSSTILFVPPWSIVLVALIIMAATWQVRRKQRHNLR